MDFTDEQDYQVLSKIYQITAKNPMPIREFHKIFEDTLGNSWDRSYDRFCRTGLVLNPGTHCYTSEAGVRKYVKLKSDKRKERIIGIVTWVTLAAAIVSAIYAVLTYYDSGITNNSQEEKLKLKQGQPSTVPHQTLEPDTTSDQDTLLIVSDSLQKKLH